MIVGYLFPDNEIYTLKFEPKGKFEYEKDEKIILESNNINIGYASQYWNNQFDLSFGLDEGLGHLIKTNKRLIYYRTINPTSSFRFWNFAPRAITEIFKAKKLKKEGILEYFDLYLNEIRGYIEYDFLIFKSFNGILFYIESLKKTNEVVLKDFYIVAFKEKYKIIDDPIILKKRLTKKEIKEMKKEEKKYMEYISNLTRNK